MLALTNDGEQLVDLFGEWQTEELKNVVNEDGTLPKNEYGNYELFSGDPPVGTLHLDLPFIARLCRNQQIEHVDTVTGKIIISLIVILFKGLKEKMGEHILLSKEF